MLLQFLWVARLGGGLGLLGRGLGWERYDAGKGAMGGTCCSTTLTMLLL